MTEDNLQWLTLAFMFLWLLMISRWVSETTTLLKSWWNDHLRDMIKDRWKGGGRVEPTRPWPDPPKRNGND